MTRGAWKELDGSWSKPRALTALGDKLYIAEGSSIWRVADDGAYEAISEDTWESRLLVGVSGWLVALEPNGSLYRVNPTDGGYTRLDGEWSKAVAMCAGGDHVYAFDGGTLYRITAADGTWHAFDGEWSGAAHLVASGGALLAFEHSGNLYRVSPKDGTWSNLESTWPNTVAAAADDQHAYVVTGNAMYSIDAATGEYELLNEDTWNTRYLTVMGGNLYALEHGGGLYRIDLS
jgi:hypothetical protein